MRDRRNLTSLAKVALRLKEDLAHDQRNISDTQIRDGLIERFEFTHEISDEKLKRYLEMTSASPEAYGSLSFQDLIRTGYEQGLLQGDWPRWRVYREMRARSSHAYDEDTALAVVQGIPAFLDEVGHFLGQLRERLS